MCAVTWVLEQELELALEAITSAIAEFLPKSHADAPVWRNYTSWREWYARKGAQYLDTRGWLLFKLGRVDEATADVQQSIIMKEMEENHHHLATVLLDQGQPAAAFESLVQAALVRQYRGLLAHGQLDDAVQDILPLLRV